MSDIFEQKSITPMLIGADGEPFDDPNYLYELKWDGERCLAYLDPKEGTELRNKRNDRMLPKVPELTQLHKQVKKRCILDGELMVLVNGKPDFFAIQRRSLMSNKFKIELEASRFPASFIAFDILYLDGEETTSLPLTKRKALLKKTVRENDRLAISRTIEENGIQFFELAKAQELEGIVAKRKDSLYFTGKRTKDWIKIKHLQDDDFVVCGYIEKSDFITSLVLGQYHEGELTYKGHVTLGVSGEDFSVIKRHRAIPAPLMEIPAGHGNESAVWLSPDLVCKVKYMMKTQNGGMRQPVFKGLRDDKKAEDCISS